MSDERGGALTHIGSLLERLLRGHGVAEGVERASVVPRWEEIVGPQIARVTEPTGFQHGTLFVDVRSSAWLMELRMMERQILIRLNAGRRHEFQRIVFRQGTNEEHPSEVDG